MILERTKLVTSGLNMEEPLLNQTIKVIPDRNSIPIAPIVSSGRLRRRDETSVSNPILLPAISLPFGNSSIELVVDKSPVHKYFFRQRFPEALDVLVLYKHVFRYNCCVHLIIMETAIIIYSEQCVKSKQQVSLPSL